MMEFSSNTSIDMLLKKRPVVSLVDKPRNVDPRDTGYKTLHSMVILDAKNISIGYIDLEKILWSEPQNSERRRFARIQKIKLDDGYPGEGYGKAAYLELLKYLWDMPLVASFHNLNENATKIWKSLVRDGLAREDYSEVGGQNEFIGYVSIPKAR